MFLVPKILSDFGFGSSFKVYSIVLVLLKFMELDLKS